MTIQRSCKHAGNLASVTKIGFSGAETLLTLRASFEGLSLAFRLPSSSTSLFLAVARGPIPGHWEGSGTNFCESGLATRVPFQRVLEGDASENGDSMRQILIFCSGADSFQIVLYLCNRS